jgi:hypothetical protein
MCVSCTGREATFFSASGVCLLQKVADGKINVPSACTMDMVYVGTTFVAS